VGRMAGEEFAERRDSSTISRWDEWWYRPPSKCLEQFHAGIGL
jgi:hypothetical protein